eukprot:g1978.t1
MWTAAKVPQDVVAPWKTASETNGPRRPNRRKSDPGTSASSLRRGSRRLRRHPRPKKSVLTSQESYRVWIDEQRRKQQELNMVKGEPTATALKNAAEVKCATRLQMFRKKYFNQPTEEQKRLMSKEYASAPRADTGGADNKEKGDGGVPLVGKLKRSEPRAASSTKRHGISANQSVSADKGERKDELSLEPTVYSTARLKHEPWLKDQHVNFLENYPVLSPRTTPGEPPVSDNSFVEEALYEHDNGGGLTGASQAIQGTLIDSDRKRIENIVREVAQKIAKSYRKALESEKYRHDEEVKDVKQGYETELKLLVAAYDEKLSYYVRRTQHTQQTEVAVRELVEINSRILRSGKGNQVAPAHIRKNLESWDRRNRVIFQEGPPPDVHESLHNELLNQKLTEEIAKETVTVKPWTPNYNSSGASKRNSRSTGNGNTPAEGGGSGKKGKKTEKDHGLNLTMLQTLRKQNEDFRQAEEAVRLKLESAQVAISAKNEEIKLMSKRYADMEAKYKAAMKEVKLLEYQGGRGRRY